MKNLLISALLSCVCFVFVAAQETETGDATPETQSEETPKIEIPAGPTSEEETEKSDDEDGLQWIDSGDEMDETDKDQRPFLNLRNSSSREKREVETLAKGPFSIGFFVGQTSKVTELNGEAGLLMGGQAMFVFNHKFNIGGAGYGLVTPVEPLGAGPSSDDYLVFGYGGMVFEPVFRAEKAIHFSIPILLGAGAYGERRGYWNEPDFDEPFWVVEPGLNVNLNVFRVFQVGIGASYRYVADAFVADMETEELNGLAGHLSLKFGWF